jgi:hypothetical protein
MTFAIACCTLVPDFSKHHSNSSLRERAQGELVNRQQPEDLMNLTSAQKKMVLFGVFGALGCLAGWLVGEPFLAIAMPAGGAGGRGGSLVSRPEPPRNEAPPPPPEFRERLDSAGAKSGDVQISLKWDNTNDLDLHCIDPQNFRISFADRRSPSGGELDVDRNAACGNTVSNPIENIYWPAGGAAMGKYKVYVHYYQHCSGAPQETAYEVSVLTGTLRQEFKGTISREKELKPIYEFDVQPRVEVFAPQRVDIAPGTTMKVPIAVRRSFYRGPVTLSLQNLAKGLAAVAVTLDPDQNTADLELKAESSAPVGTQTARVKALGGSTDAEIDLPVTVPAEKASSFWFIIILGLWTGLLAIGLTLALQAGQNRYLQRPLFSGTQSWAVLGGSAAAGFVSGAVGQVLFALLATIGIPSVGFLAGWVLLGGLLAWGVSTFIPNMVAGKAAAAGAVGGFGGALAFLIASLVADAAGRFVGAAILGFCIGVMVALAEATFRQFWLEIHHGLERRTVNLGAQPVTLGSDLRNCTIFARQGPPLAGAFRLENGRVLWEDRQTGAVSEMPIGKEQTFGGVTLTVRSASSAPHAAPPAPPPPPPVPRAPARAAGSVPTAPVVAPRPASAPPPVPERRAPPPPPPPGRKPPPPPPGLR